MYEAFFELNGRPFPATPDPSSYFSAASHEEALTLLKCGLNDGESMAVLLGGPGTGKTLLCHQLIDAMDPHSALVFLNGINNPNIEPMLQAILHDLSLPYEQGGEQNLRLRLHDFVMDRFSHGCRTVIFVDEAQNLSLEQLEELRLLTNLEGRSDKAVQVLLIGQERLEEILAQPALAGLSQRIAVTARLRRLTDDETMEYVRHQIGRVGGSADSIFTASALSEVCEYAAGIPRRINQLCHRALTLAYAHQCGTLDGEYVHMAALQLFLVKPTDRVESHHVSLAGTPRRLFNDRVFEHVERGERSRAEDRGLGESTTEVVEIGGGDDDWSVPQAGDSTEVGSNWKTTPTDEDAGSDTIEVTRPPESHPSQPRRRTTRGS